jgi:hypothetical protein
MSKKEEKGKEKRKEKRRQHNITKISTRQSWLQQQTPKQKQGQEKRSRQKILWLEFQKQEVFRNNGELQLAASYRHRDEQVLVIPHKNGYQPEPAEPGLYPCLPLLPGWNPLFIKRNTKVFTIKVLPLERKTKTINGTEITVLDSSVFVPHWVIKKHETTILFRDGNCRLIWIEDIQKRRTVVQELNRAEKNVSGVKNPWTENKRSGMIEPPVYSQLKKEVIVSIVKYSIDKPAKKQIEELAEKGLASSENGKTKIILPGSVGI